MARIATLVALGATLLAFASADGIYTKNSPVLQVTGKSYDNLIAQSNHTSILEFYAPWCGHCQNLKPAYEKAAKNLAGLAKVAAIDCDEESNKAFCGQMGVKGFPTLKIVRPGKKPGRPVVEDYDGARSTKAIVDAVVDKIPNHVKRLKDPDLDGWLADTTTASKAILFSTKGTTASLIKAVAVDFLGSISIAQIRDKEMAAVDRFGITDFPTMILIPGAGKDPVKYAGEMKKEALLKFFGQAAAPNPDPAPKQAKSSATTKKSKGARSSSSASEADKVFDYDDFIDASTIVLGDNTPTESPMPIVPPEGSATEIPEVIPAIPMLSSAEELEAACFTRKSGTCILVLLPAGSGPDATLPHVATEVLTGMAELAHKHTKRGAHIFPFYGMAAENEGASVLRGDLGLQSNSAIEIVATNVKRNWWRHFERETYDVVSLEGFVDEIKLGEGTKQKLPKDFGRKATETPESPRPIPVADTEVPIGTVPAESVPEPEPLDDPKAHIHHGEL